MSAVIKGAVNESVPLVFGNFVNGYYSESESGVTLQLSNINQSANCGGISITESGTTYPHNFSNCSYSNGVLTTGVINLNPIIESTVGYLQFTPGTPVPTK